MTEHEKISFDLPHLSPELTDALWDDTKLRHAYLDGDRKVALCGYTGPSTWRGEKTVPPNVCPICLALLRDRGWRG
jgi:hypothetical protein